MFLGLALVLLFLLNLFYGSVNIPVKSVLLILLGEDIDRISWTHIVLNSRLPQALTALLSGAALASSGLLLQTLFRNPLAGPSILGISNGASMGVAVVMLYFGSGLGVIFDWKLGSYITTVLAAFLGASLILLFNIYFATKVKNNVMLLIIGIMIGYLSSSLISVLNYYSAADKVQQYVMWGMGDFAAVNMDKLPFFAAFVIFSLIFALTLAKTLNILLLGENYASNLGVNIKRARLAILICTGILTATVTAFCGPISFIGLSVPHLARLSLSSSNHRHLLPITMLAGGCVTLLCNILTIVPGSNTLLPLNAITPLICAPIIIYVVINRKNIQYFN